MSRERRDLLNDLGLDESIVFENPDYNRFRYARNYKFL